MNTQDQIAIIIFGSISILFVGIIAHASFLFIGLASLGFAGAVILYTRLAHKSVAGKARKSLNEMNALRNADSFRLAEGLAEAILTLGAEGEIIYANPAAQDMFTLKTNEMSHSRVIQQPLVLAAIKDALHGRVPDPVTYEIETPILRHIRVTAAPIKNTSSENSPQRVLVVFYDITDLVISNTLRSDFLANASHELKTPIASILGYIETLRGHAKNDAEARDRFLIIMQQQAERMQRLITDILSLRRIEQIEHIAPSTRGDLYLAAKAARESLAPLAKERGVKISFKNKQELLVLGDQDELVQLVLNLLDNAVQMSPPGSKIKLSFAQTAEWRPGAEFSNDPISLAAPRRKIVNITNTEGSYASVRIRDHGPGFATEHLPRLSERFYRVIGDRTSREKGTGLGLAIVKHIVRRHRGGLFVESVQGVGTEFSIFIPLASTD